MDIYKNNKVVAVGGGHGLGRILAALRDFKENATGIVTTTDNGGSTGRIRFCQGGIAWGDTRNCLNQLITEPTISSMLFEYRFRGAGELDGHNLGNLILAAVDNLSIRPLEAINLVREFLRIKTKILPMSEHPSDLRALSTGGKWVKGETSVDEMEDELLRLDLDPEVPAINEAITALKEADAIILGPGSFLTSIMPPLLLPELGKAIKSNTKAKVIFIENLSPEFGPAGRMGIEQKLDWITRACQNRRPDVILGNQPNPELSEQWNTVTRDLASYTRGWRHDRDKLRDAILEQLQ
ncbi:uridine diphosphate-N-acetylglucosamine-binding protein YvcK [Vibrio gallicus]|uniref:uridine diphosphate-N-acetylglucosamine-binding protein YvcK n=1 Tax=Vibrio gallicus TaxID=190897 RepID=UPI0021C28F3C|nr:uridine diphosphate-N-acetylglucosamine-binding protein YvcK [Vibrio gallicus]